MKRKPYQSTYPGHFTPSRCHSSASQFAGFLILSIDQIDDQLDHCFLIHRIAFGNH
jgi:hypothetical protein